MKSIKNGNLLTWPGFKNQTLLKNLRPSIATNLGHLYQERKNLQSKKQVKPELDIGEDKYLYPEIETVKKHELCATIIPLNTKRKGFSDITGALPHKSIRGKLYGVVMYDYNSNVIISELIKNRQAATICDDFP